MIAAAAYRAGEKLYDRRQDMVHDYSRRSGVVHTELMFPADAPDWVRGIGREDFWNRVDAGEKRKDAQTAREIRITIPRELLPEDRIALVRDFVQRAFVDRGMVADLAVHNPLASDGLDNCHAHVMLTMRMLTADGFGPKSRTDRVPDPEGRTHPDGRPVMVESNPNSWNSVEFYEIKCRQEWERTANDALARMGSPERIDRRSLVERGLARMPEPALRLAFHLKELKSVMRERWGQFSYAKHYQEVEKRAKAAFQISVDPVAELKARAEGRAYRPTRRDESPAHLWQRFHDWIDRQIDRLAGVQPEHAHSPPMAERAAPRQPPPTYDMER